MLDLLDSYLAKLSLNFEEMRFIFNCGTISVFVYSAEPGHQSILKVWWQLIYCSSGNNIIDNELADLIVFSIDMISKYTITERA